MQEENEQRALKDSRAEQLLTRQMQFERRPKTCKEKKPCGEKCAGNLGSN